MSKHTPEPWVVAAKALVRLDSAYLIEAAESHDFKYGATLAATSKQDARRIVACVNACAGVDTDLLEAGELDKPTMLVIQENKDLKHRCDELLAALDGLLADMRLRARINGDVDSDGCAVINCGNGVLYAANAAIAKAKGL